MIIKKIPKDDQSLLSASVYINSYKRAIEELVMKNNVSPLILFKISDDNFN